MRELVKKYYTGWLIVFDSYYHHSFAYLRQTSCPWLLQTMDSALVNDSFRSCCCRKESLVRWFASIAIAGSATDSQKSSCSARMIEGPQIMLSLCLLQLRAVITVSYRKAQQYDTDCITEKVVAAVANRQMVKHQMPHQIDQMELTLVAAIAAG